MGVHVVAAKSPILKDLLWAFLLYHAFIFVCAVLRFSLAISPARIIH